MDWNALAERTLAGQTPSREEALAVLQAPDEALLEQLAAAYRVRRHYWGNRIRLHFLLNAQSGLCQEDCHYCAQSKISAAQIEQYPLLAQEQILQAAEQAHRLQSGTFCLVMSGRGPTEATLPRVLEAVREIKSRYPLKVCACLGLLAADQAQRLAEAGVDRVNHNLNTSEAHHSNICTTHTFADRVATLRNVQSAGMTTCCGGILGMGESDGDVVDLARSLRELDVTSVPINFLIPIDGTPLGGHHQLDPRYCLRALCLYRFLLPDKEIRIAGGREYHLRSLQPLGLYPANSIFIADYLTTPGQAAEQDLQTIRDAGFSLEAADGSALDAATLERAAADARQASPASG
ncbi:MAG: biotin synthase BioB [Cyanobacteria bacterium QS_8_64_29]|nr:MAG: biotin synthase BioB [Cyanobacteria bacterium QS_8_64_29]